MRVADRLGRVMCYSFLGGFILTLIAAHYHPNSPPPWMWMLLGGCIGLFGAWVIAVFTERNDAP